MANRGLTMVIAAKRSANGIYIDGFRCKNAIKVAIDPVYEDVSDYNDINDTDDAEVFAYADIELDKTGLSAEEEDGLLGRNAVETRTISTDNDMSNKIGVGLRVNDGKQYKAIWFPNVVFKEGGSEHNTKKEEITYDTANLKGKITPDSSGIWRERRLFNTKKEADSWLYEKAGIVNGGM